MWIDQHQNVINDNDQYTAPDGVTYPWNFPKTDIVGLSPYTPPPAPPPTAEEQRQLMQAAIIQGMTDLFDRTAQSRHYDNRVTCALRAGYPGPFHAEGTAFAEWMDAQNARAYTLLAQVQAGTMAMPASVADALNLLDPMVWPS